MSSFVPTLRGNGLPTMHFKLINNTKHFILVLMYYKDVNAINIKDNYYY